MNVAGQCGFNILTVNNNILTMQLSEVFDNIINVVEQLKELFAKIYNYLTSRK